MNPGELERKLASPNGFPTKHWGPSGWRLIHLAALNFPLEPVSDEVRQGYLDFFNSLCYILPCGVCRQEFCKMVKNPNGKYFLSKMRFKPRNSKIMLPPWQTRFDLFKWTVDIHTAVNARLGKGNTTKEFPHWFMYYLKMRAPSKRH